jgi:hypothetical protein
VAPTTDPRVIEAVGKAYYTRAVAAADLARTRAQNGFAVASFLAGGLVGAAVLRGLEAVPIAAPILGACALSAWVLAAALYARALAEPVDLLTGEQPDADAFVRKALDNAAEERDKVDTRARSAHRVSLAAATVTVAAVAVGVLVPASQPETVFVLLSTRGMAAISELCGDETNPIRGRLETADLDAQFVTLEPDDPRCDAGVVHLPTRNILQVLTEE